jgi:threonine/homoserine/homoserine lactone efflux protein
LASMFGLSAVLHRWPSVLRAVSAGGAVYLTYLGLRALWKAVVGTAFVSRNRAEETSPNNSSALMTGIITNFLNPSVVLFYMLLLPQFIAATDPFIQRFLVLATLHVSMSLAWLTAYALAVGSLSERMERPWVRRSMEAATGLILVILGAGLVLK